MYVTSSYVIAIEKLLEYFLCLTHWLKNYLSVKASLCQMNMENINATVHVLHPKKFAEKLSSM